MNSFENYGKTVKWYHFENYYWANLYFICFKWFAKHQSFMLESAFSRVYTYVLCMCVGAGEWRGGGEYKKAPFSLACEYWAENQLYLTTSSPLPPPFIYPLLSPLNTYKDTCFYPRINKLKIKLFWINKLKFCTSSFFLYIFYNLISRKIS